MIDLKALAAKAKADANRMEELRDTIQNLSDTTIPLHGGSVDVNLPRHAPSAYATGKEIEKEILLRWSEITTTVLARCRVELAKIEAYYAPLSNVPTQGEYPND